MTNAEAQFNNSLHPQKPEGSLGQTAQDGHLDSHTAPELCSFVVVVVFFVLLVLQVRHLSFFSYFLFQAHNHSVQ